MPGGPDPLYVAARSVLLDALEALGSHRDALILVGAQAIYLHTGDVDLAVAEHTTDADVIIDPRLLGETPEIESAFVSAGFLRGPRVGAWVTTREIGGDRVSIEVDLMVPEALGGPGRRAARLKGHNPQVARKARGLEAALVDKRFISIGALDPGDRRTCRIAVAGPAALLISKLHKIRERILERRERRLDDKDALDVLRILRAIPTADLAGTMTELMNEALAAEVTRDAVTALREFFSGARSAGAQMAARAAGALATSEEIAESVAILATDLLDALNPT
jgi:hypothetical protein